MMLSQVRELLVTHTVSHFIINVVIIAASHIIMNQRFSGPERNIFISFIFSRLASLLAVCRSLATIHCTLINIVQKFGPAI